MVHNFKDLSNKKFGRLVAIKTAGKNKWQNYLWECFCDCGNKITVTSGDLRSGHTKSCGCLNMEKVKVNRLTHGMGDTRFYRIWAGIKSRCENPNNVKIFSRYGKNGIKCLWSSFEQFRDDMYEGYKFHVQMFGEKQTTIDRIDNNGNYCKENCRWATYHIQRMNQRRMLVS